MTDLIRPDAEEPENSSVLDLFGLSVLDNPAPSIEVAEAEIPALAPATSRRELRERERAALAGPPAHAVADALASATVEPSAQAAAAPLVRGRKVSRTPRVQRDVTRASRARSMGSRLLSLGAMVFAAALAVGMSVPANAFYSGSGAGPADAAELGPGQVVQMAVDQAGVAATRDEWSVLSWAEVLKQRYGTRDFGYTVGSGPVRWPFPFEVEISSGFGERVAPCRGCSSYHQGLDFNPGNGAAIFAIADGTVVLRQADQWGFGNHVMIEHEIDGHTVISTYAHMQHGSSPLNVGDVVQVGDFVGLVGRTGTATGPHLHFEIEFDGVTVDPFTFLKQYAS